MWKIAIEILEIEKMQKGKDGVDWIFPHIIYKYYDMPTKRIGHCKNCGNEKRHRKKSFYG